MIVLSDEFVTLDTPFGPMRTHITRPAAPGRYPGIVFYSEIFQITAPIRRMAASESTDPLGLFGFDTYTSRVFSVTARSNSSQSTAQSSSMRSRKVATSVPRLFGTPINCM